VGKGRVLRGLKSFWKILKIEFSSCPAVSIFGNKLIVREEYLSCRICG
jgi:hypothetical protein